MSDLHHIEEDNQEFFTQYNPNKQYTASESSLSHSRPTSSKVRQNVCKTESE